jgi:molybdopterin-guanine dinucleotide biosynthesis protein A
MGTDKASLPWGGATLLARAVEVLREVADPVLLAVGVANRYPAVRAPRVYDRRAGAGPLAGLEAALAWAEGRDEWCCVLACDMPLVSAGLFRALLARCERAHLQVCLAATRSGDEPLCAVVHASCSSAVSAALERGDRRLTSFHPGLGVGRLQLAEEHELVSANSPAAYGALRARAEAS